MKIAVAIGLLRVLFRGRNCQCRRPPQLSYAPPTIPALPPRHQFEDFVDGVMLLLGAEFDARDEKLINGGQQARAGHCLASNVFDNARHIQNRAASQRAVHTTVTTNGAGTASQWRFRNQHDAQAGAELPTASHRDAKMGDILARFACRSCIFLPNGRDCGQRLKPEDLAGLAED